MEFGLQVVNRKIFVLGSIVTQDKAATKDELMKENTTVYLIQAIFVLESLA